MKRSIVVVKFGSELVTNEHGVDHVLIAEYAEGLIKAYKPSDLIIVTSGAVKTGLARAKQIGSTISYDEVTLAQLGAAQIVSAWEQAFAKQGVLAGGLLVTHHELTDSNEGPKFITALRSALQVGVVSIVNENDALSDTELMQLAVGGDNDGLAAHIAQKVGASKLVLFTAKGGILDDDNHLIATINSSNADSVQSMLVQRGRAKKSVGAGRGGIVTKFSAARSAAQSGVLAIIAKPAPDMHGELITEFVVG